MEQLFQEVEWLGATKDKVGMENTQRIIQDYKEGRLSLEEFQEAIWGLSESALETISEKYFIFISI